MVCVWRRTSWAELSLSDLDQFGSFPRRSGSPTWTTCPPWLTGPSFRSNLFGILFRGSHHPLVSPLPMRKKTCAGQCFCNHVTASATATTTGESIDSAASSSTTTKDKELRPAQRSVAGGDPGAQGYLDIGRSCKRSRGQWVRPNHRKPGPVCLGRRRGEEPPS